MYEYINVGMDIYIYVCVYVILCNCGNGHISSKHLTRYPKQNQTRLSWSGVVYKIKNSTKGIM